MRLKVNNKEVEAEILTLQDFAQEFKLAANGIAIAVNQRMVPRTEWHSYVLNEGDSIIIIKAVCGG